ncbi:tryptophan ABC transporter substrate-binding protein [Vagococcus elongatus]|uniref:Peptide ABC transporter substrate-binding protein n=1 Tax=Vagococcus elongatus TaxID=180344 RepID=A0A430AZQ7_9ENTE|nr:tryptophan ABC transporter substrate-binding protein [Vagococcus elongatus]RSU13516.1 peptide ABC transporter substrate-binding protein [Vagococcus elongatus]
MNKRLLVAIAALLGILTYGFIAGKNEPAENEKKAVTEIPTVGVLQFVSHPALDQIYQGMVDRLEERGFQDGKTVTIEFQNGQADHNKLTMMSQQLLDKKSDVLVGIATPAAQSLANVTKDIPIILGAITNPESAGLVASNEKPGGNITGVSDQSPVNSQIELLKEILPEAQKIGILFSLAEDNSEFQVQMVEKEAKKRGLETKRYAIPSTNEITQMVSVMAGEVDVIYIPTDNTIANVMPTVTQIANQENIPIIPSVDTMVAEGGLATIGINQYELGLQTGEMVADILEEKSEPATTPVYTFKTGDLIVNEKQMARFNVTLSKKRQEEATFVTGEKEEKVDETTNE